MYMVMSGFVPYLLPKSVVYTFTEMPIIVPKLIRVLCFPQDVPTYLHYAAAGNVSLHLHKLLLEDRVGEDVTV